MSRILVSGLINIETTVRIDGFPIEYFPVRYPFHGVRSTISGVGYNVASALRSLGDDVRLISMLGTDPIGAIVPPALAARDLSPEGVLPLLEETPQSVILFEPSGRRQIHVDLKKIQETRYPLESFEKAVENCCMAALCNINFSRELLPLVKARGIPIATDVHALSSLDDEYNRDFIAAADIVFMSHEKLPGSPADFTRDLFQRFQTRIAVVGLGPDGAFIRIRDEGISATIPACNPRAIVNTIGAGDALFSAFIHELAQGIKPVAALTKAVLFAGWKIGENGGAEGFLTSVELNLLGRNRL